LSAEQKSKEILLISFSFFTENLQINFFIQIPKRTIQLHPNRQVFSQFKLEWLAPGRNRFWNEELESGEAFTKK
jgi:hypothetical protein